jgi:hypothetical protein
LTASERWTNEPPVEETRTASQLRILRSLDWEGRLTISTHDSDNNMRDKLEGWSKSSSLQASATSSKRLQKRHKNLQVGLYKGTVMDIEQSSRAAHKRMIYQSIGLISHQLHQLEFSHNR